MDKNSDRMRSIRNSGQGDRMRLLLGIATLLGIMAAGSAACAGETAVSVSSQNGKGSFALIQNGRPSDI